MRILVAHNRYQQSGGEDNVAAAEADLLEEHGHAVERVHLDNDHIQSAWSQLTAGARSIYSPRGRSLLQAAIERHRPDVVHVHNFFPTLSPSAFHACAAAGVPVVHTLHNFRLICAGATLFRAGAVCEECPQTRSFLPGVRHACYRGSRAGSAVSGFGMALHDRLGTWAGKVSAYIALTPFSAAKLSEYRLPREKIFIKPNFTADLGVGSGGENHALFVGRLSPEKGLQTIIDADLTGLLPMDVVVLGDGPMMPALQQAAQRPGSRLLVKGRQSHEQILDAMRRARVLLLPSLWYEGLPLVLIEAFSLGLPVVGTAHGNLASLIEPHHNGLLYPPGDHAALARTLTWLQDHPEVVERLREGARAAYLARYTPEANYRELITIYRKVLAPGENMVAGK